MPIIYIKNNFEYVKAICDVSSTDIVVDVFDIYDRLLLTSVIYKSSPLFWEIDSILPMNMIVISEKWFENIGMFTLISKNRAYTILSESFS